PAQAGPSCEPRLAVGRISRAPRAMMIRTDVASLEHPLAATNAEPRAGTAARARPDVVGRAARLRSLSVPARVAYGVTCLYAAVFTFFAVARHLAFLSQRDDLGNMT